MYSVYVVDCRQYYPPNKNVKSGDYALSSLPKVESKDLRSYRLETKVDDFKDAKSSWQSDHEMVVATFQLPAAAR